MSPIAAVAREAAIPNSPTFSAIVVDANSGRTLYSCRRGRAAPSRLRHQGHDALSAVRAARKGRHDPRHAAFRSPSTPRRRSPRSSAFRPARRSTSTTRSRRSSPVPPTTSRWRSPKRSAATKTTFASMMTRKAHVARACRNTVYRNASGLPNNEQVTTAHDLAVLGRVDPGAFPALLQVLLDPRIRLRRRR